MSSHPAHPCSKESNNEGPASLRKLLSFSSFTARAQKMQRPSYSSDSSLTKGRANQVLVLMSIGVQDSVSPLQIATEQQLQVSEHHDKTPGLVLAAVRRSVRLSQGSRIGPLTPSTCPRSRRPDLCPPWRSFSSNGVGSSASWTCRRGSWHIV